MSETSPTSTSVKEQIRHLPPKPGIYKYYDSQNRLLYIGKAKNLKKRVSTYFTSKRGHSGRTKVMVDKIRNVEYTIVNNEFDALLLENSLIKKLQPRYNVNLRDDKTYPFLCIKNERFPRIISTRLVVKDGSDYFGPYASVSRMNITLDLIRKLFPLRSCNYALTDANIEAGKFKVCLDYHIKLCKGPCEGLQTEEDYNTNIGHIREILKGNSQAVIRHLRTMMEKAAAEMRFEDAQRYKFKLEKLVDFQNKSLVANTRIHNVDIFSIHSDDKLAVVNFLKVVNGTVIQTDTLEYRKKLEEEDRDILLLAITEIREKYNSTSREIIVPFPLRFQYQDLKFTVPKAGDKKHLLDLSKKNAFFFFKEKMKQKEENQGIKPYERVLARIKEDLRLERTPYHMECFDNSNMQGSEPVASMVCFRNARPSKKDYRHYNIRSVEGPDDYASMSEVVMRRYRRLKEEEQPLPQLVIIDGGKGQLSAAMKSIRALELQDKIEIRAIAKKLEEIYKPGDPLPMMIDKKSESLRTMQHIRNEAHRFAITHHRGRRIKKNLISGLENIPGVGKATAQKLLSHFKSIKKIKEANLEDLQKVVGKKMAARIKEAAL
ncbi:MAG: excinuclease ABC subunit UvrC [Bacteroidia bacterium]